VTMAELIDNHHARRDLRQLESAIRKGFKIGDAVYDTLANHMAQIVTKGNNREKTAAAKVLIAMAEFNARQEQPQQQPQTVVNVGVNVDNRTDDKPLSALQFAEQYRAQRVSRRIDG